ncbi:unnamed protein product [Soboliphyme baturini]|uniref:V-type proton ATPase subunit a n=1 Tax=Soboliphyme baturini TaxID=241478 RepID=A0A183IPD2_9BILA|nr:unnamed protein product [Soboliphyme baturini]
MGSLFRSEEMCRCQLFLQTEAAYACVAELGELGLVQFRDLNPNVNVFQRKFVNEVRRCDEMERMLRFLEKEIKKDRIPILDTGENPDAPQPREMIDLEATFEKLDNELREVNTNEEMLKRNFLELTELKHILRKAQTFFEEAPEPSSLIAEDRELLIPHEEPLKSAALKIGQSVGLRRSEGRSNTSRLSLEIRVCHFPRYSFKLSLFSFDKVDLRFVAGVILRERLPSFERMLWRACRGNVFLKQADIGEPLEDPITGDYVRKCVVIIFFQGEQLKSRVKKICEGFRATLYPCPETSQERREMALGVMTRIEDLKTVGETTAYPTKVSTLMANFQVLSQTQDHRHRVLMAASKNIRIWFTKVRKIKAVYHTLNLFNLDVTQKCLIAECWCPVSDLDKIQLALKRGTEESGSSIPSILNRMECAEPPPTYNRTNKFTSGFQGIVDAYGVANYREVNPTPYTIVTFPFLFAVMFGDMGHGLLMFFFALFLVVKEKQLAARKIRDEVKLRYSNFEHRRIRALIFFQIFSIFFGGRYIILLMGIFSIYTGFVYNEVYSKSINVFGSSWKSPFSPNELPNVDKIQLSPNDTKAFLGHSYPYGFDPIWSLAENKLNFLNSFKMKMSIILGVAQMLFGVLLSFVNFRFFKKPLDIYGVFIPELLFMSCIFLYLCILICYKWVTFSCFETFFPGLNSTYPGSQCAPSLLIGLIDMFMFASNRPTGFNASGCPADPLFYPHQVTLCCL